MYLVHVYYAILLTAYMRHSAAFVDHANVGVMYSMFDAAGQVDTAGIMQLTGMQIALDHINNKTDGVADELLPLIELRMVARAPLPTFTSGAAAAIEMTAVEHRKGVIACAGPGSIDAMRVVSRAFQDWGIPIVGYSANEVEMVDWYHFQNVLRTRPLEIVSAHAVEDVAVHHNWRRVSVMYSEDRERYGANSDMLFMLQLERTGLDILSVHKVFPGREKAALEEMKEVGANIYILFMDAAAALPVLRVGHVMGVFGEGKQIIGTERMSVAENWADLDVTAGELNTLLRGYIGVRWEETPDTASVYYQSFLASWYRLESTAGVMQRDGSEACSNATDDYGEFYLHQSGGVCAGLNYSSFSVADLWPAYSAYDAVFAIARGYHALWDIDNIDVASAALYDHMLHQLSFDGVTGQVDFSNVYEDIMFDLGGRSGDMSFRIVNYQCNDYDLRALGSFVPAMLWTTREGLSNGSCGVDGCFKFRFNTADNSPPKDQPEAVVVEYPQRYKNVIYAISLFNICLLIFYVICIYSFRKRRLVKVSQPQLSYIILFGALLIFANAILSTEHLTDVICSVGFWLYALGFGCIYIVLALKLWRVYALCVAQKRNVVSIADFYFRFFGGMFILMVVAAVNQGIGINAVAVTTMSNQFVYERELMCERHDDLFLRCTIFLMLSVGLYYCVLTRNIVGSLSNTTPSSRAITAAVIGLLMYIAVDYFLRDSPNAFRFVDKLIVMAAIGCAMWVLYFDFCMSMLMGTDLDRSLREKRTAWSVLEIRFVSALVNWFLHCGAGGIKTVPSIDSLERKKQLNKYLSMTVEQLNSEIAAQKITMLDAREQIECLENVKYTLDEHLWAALAVKETPRV